MPNRPRQQSSTLTFDRDEWELLVTLPRRVLIAASATGSPSSEPSVNEGLAGIEAIASGRGSASRLVREIVAAIYAESYHVTPSGRDDEAADRDVLQTLAACRYASEVVAQRCGVRDAAAYRTWLHHIAAAVAGAMPAAAVPVGARSGVAEGRFLYALDGILRP
jgi:hypothetical protein